MGDITRNISRYEVKCKCGQCEFDTADYEVVAGLQTVCDSLQKVSTSRIVLTITSFCRCSYHNGKVGSKFINSKHTKGKAVDFQVRGFSAENIADVINLALPASKFYYYLIDDLTVHLELDPK